MSDRVIDFGKVVGGVASGLVGQPEGTFTIGNGFVGSVPGDFGQLYHGLSLTYPVYPAPQISMRAVANGVVVTVGCFSSGAWPSAGEYVFSDMKEALEFIRACLELMVPQSNKG